MTFNYEHEKWVSEHALVPGDVFAWSTPSAADWRIAPGAWWSCFG